jgi:glycosyl transferase family 2
VSGPREFAGGRNEVVVACMVRNGEEYIEAFLTHYFKLGAKHVVLMDNGSTDRTVALARARRGVTVFECPRPVGRGETLLRRYLLNGFCRGRWCLNVDIDEFFDFPFSKTIGLGGLIGYLEANSYTAVVSQMLDMISDKPLSELKAVKNGALRKHYPFYDISRIEKSDYLGRPFGSMMKGNVVSNRAIKFHLGGIRKPAFGGRNWLTKHPLVLLDGLELTDPHCVARARCADFSGVLFHYKFTGSLLARTKDYADNGFGGMPREYAAILARGKTALLYDPSTAKRIGNIVELVDNGFLVVSDRFRRYVKLSSVNHHGKR